MTWVLTAVLGFAAWLLVVLFFLALCRAAARAEVLVSERLTASSARASSATPCCGLPRRGKVRSRRGFAATPARPTHPRIRARHSP
jgi:hypothetical protein